MITSMWCNRTINKLHISVASSPGCPKGTAVRKGRDRKGGESGFLSWGLVSLDFVSLDFVHLFSYN